MSSKRERMSTWLSMRPPSKPLAVRCDSSWKATSPCAKRRRRDELAELHEAEAEEEHELAPEDAGAANHGTWLASCSTSVVKRALDDEPGAALRAVAEQPRQQPPRERARHAAAKRALQVRAEPRRLLRPVAKGHGRRDEGRYGRGGTKRSGCRVYAMSSCMSEALKVLRISAWACGSRVRCR